MPDNEEASAALWYSEVLSVQYPFGPPIAELCEVAPHEGDVGSAVDGEKPRHVLADEPGGTCLSQQSHDVPPQSRAWVTHARATPRQGVSLARPPGGENSAAGNKSSCSEVISTHFPHVGQDGPAREPVGQDTTGRLVDLNRRRHPDPSPLEGKVNPTNTCEQ
jgi:hypothetical protein